MCAMSHERNDVWTANLSQMNDKLPIRKRITNFFPLKYQYKNYTL